MSAVLVVLALLAVVAVVVVGVGVLGAGRQLTGGSPAPGAQGATSHRGVADLVDASVRRTRVAVAELISTDVHRDDLRLSSAEFSRRGHTYIVFGVGLLGLAAVLLVGTLLLL